MQLLSTLLTLAAVSQTGVETTVSYDAPLAPGNHMVDVALFTGLFLPATNHELYDSLGTDFRRLNRVGPTIGVRFGYAPWRYIGVETEAAVIPTQNADDDGANLFAFRGHGIIQWPMRITPFALAGGGALMSSGAPGADVDPAFHWGLGAKFFTHSWLSVRAEARQIYTAARGPDAGNTSHFEVLAGITFTLFRVDRRDEWTVAEVGGYRAPEPVAAPEPARRSMAVPAEPAVVVRRALDEINFKFGSAELGPNSYPALDLAADVLRRNPRLRVRIVGHTDHVGSEVFNQGLSERRASAVRDYLVTAGIDPSRIEISGMGEVAPIAPNDTAEGRAKNRRSEFEVDVVKGAEASEDTDEPRAEPQPEQQSDPVGGASGPRR